MTDWKKAIVQVCNGNPYEGGEYIGTAFFVSAQHLLTAKHVIDKCPDWKMLRLNDGPWLGGLRALEQKPFYHPDNKDIVILKVARPEQDFDPIQTGLNDPRVGDEIQLAGFTASEQGLETPSLKVSTYDGIYDLSVVHTYISKGMSGGPVIMKNKLAGMTILRDKDKNRTYIIPISTFKRFLNETIESDSIHEQEDFHAPINLTWISALIDKIEQTKKAVKCLDKNPRQSAFIIWGEQKYWPDAVAYCLAYKLNAEKSSEPRNLSWGNEIERLEQDTENFLNSQVYESLKQNKYNKETDQSSIPELLKKEKNPLVFTLKIYPKLDSIQPELINQIIECWEQKIVHNVPVKHVLLIVITVDSNSTQESRWYSRFFKFRKKSNKNPFSQDAQGHGQQFSDRLLPPINEDLTQSHINRWKDEILPRRMCYKFESLEGELFSSTRNAMSHEELKIKVIKLLDKIVTN